MTITITGPNDFLRSEELSREVQAFVKQYGGGLAIEKVDSEEASFERISEAMTSLPFLTPKKLVVLRTPSQQKKFMEEAQELISAVDDRVDVIIYEPKLDKRLGYYKILKKITDFRDFQELDIPQLVGWIQSYVKGSGGKISSNDSRLLLDRVGVNQLIIKNEIDKLLLYSSDINKDSIELLTESTPQSTIFQLLDASLGGNHKMVTQLYQEQRMLKVEPQQIMALLTWQLHVLALVKTADKSISPQQLAKEARINPFVVQKTLGVVRDMSFAHLKKIISSALELDVRLKTENIDADEALQYYLLNLSA